MRKVELWVGGAAGGYVATVEILPLADDRMPKVVVWGERFFAIAAEQPVAPKPWRYEEAFTCFALTPSPGLPRTDHDGRRSGRCPTQHCTQLGGHNGPCSIAYPNTGV